MMSENSEVYRCGSSWPWVNGVGHTMKSNRNGYTLNMDVSNLGLAGGEDLFHERARILFHVRNPVVYILSAGGLCFVSADITPNGLASSIEFRPEYPHHK
jgi:hypothetical protein